jgi:hypothetical protein
MEQRAAEAITDAQSRAADQFNAEHVEANAMNVAYDAAQAEQAKAEAIEARRNSPEVRDMNEAADVAVFGSRGRTAGYVDAAGNALTQPLTGKLDEVRDTAGVAARRSLLEEKDRRAAVEARDPASPRHQYATPITETPESVDAYEAGRNDDGKEYIQRFENLRAEGFEPTQAQLILDLGKERQQKENSLYAKLFDSYKASMNPNQASAKAAEQVNNLTLTQGNNELLLRRIIRKEGLFNRDEYDKFRFKHGRPAEGERRKFLVYKKEMIDAVKDNRDERDRNRVLAEHNQKKTAKAENAQFNADHMEARAMNRAVDEEQARLEAERLAALANMPVADPSPRGLRNRVRNIMAEANAFLTVRGAQVGEFFSNDDGTRDRSRVVGAVAGSVVLLGGAYLGTKGLGLVDGSVAHHVADVAPKGHGNHVAHEAAAAHSAAHQAAEQAERGATLHLDAAHNSIESAVADHLHLSMDNPNVGKVTEVVLHHQGINWDEARNLSSGYSFNLPPQHVIEELLKNSSNS